MTVPTLEELYEMLIKQQDTMTYYETQFKKFVVDKCYCRDDLCYCGNDTTNDECYCGNDTSNDECICCDLDMKRNLEIKLKKYKEKVDELSLELEGLKVKN